MPDSVDTLPKMPNRAAVSLPEDTLSSFGGLSVEAEEQVTRFFVPKADQEERDSVETWVDLEAFLRDGELREKPTTALNYHLKRRIGRGGFAEVWESEQPSLRRRVALKKVRRDLEERASEEGVRLSTIGVSFTLEALVTASLEHPNILPIYDLGHDENGYPMLAMKLLEDTPWNAQIKQDFRLPVREFLDRHLPILIDTAQAVAFAHSRGIVHRDIKPSQVLLGRFGEVLLTDWGLALVYDEETYAGFTSPEFAKLIPNLRTATNPAGTLAFMAPEQTTEDCSGIGPWTDIYLLGGTLFYLLTGNVPHPEKDSRTAFEQARSGVFPNPTNFFNERFIPPDLAEIARRALEKNPEDRYGSVLEFIDALKDFLSGTSRRKESIALTEEIAEEYEKTADDYVQLANLLNKVDFALNQWSDNYRAQCLREEMLRRICAMAIENNEFVLARAHAMRMDDWAVRNDMIQRIDSQRQEVTTCARRRKWAVYAVLAILAVFVFLTLFFLTLYIRGQEELNQVEERLLKASSPSPPTLVEPAG